MRKLAVEYGKNNGRTACRNLEKVVQLERMNDALVQVCIKEAYMAGKAQKPVETIEIEGEILNTVSYAAYYCRLPLFTSFKIFNTDVENAEDVTVSVCGSTQLILPAEVHIEEIPHESSVEAIPQNLLNPKYLADLEQPEVCTVSVKLTCGKSPVCELEANVTALPIDCWSGLSGNAEMLSSFVRPKIADCQKILAEAGLQLKTWGYSTEFAGYAGTDKTACAARRRQFSRQFTALTASAKRMKI